MRNVGWVERSEAHRVPLPTPVRIGILTYKGRGRKMVGLAPLDPPYRNRPSTVEHLAMASDLIRMMHALFLPAAHEVRHVPWHPYADVYRTPEGWLVKFDLAG